MATMLSYFLTRTTGHQPERQPELVVLPLGDALFPVLALGPPLQHARVGPRRLQPDAGDVRPLGEAFDEEHGVGREPALHLTDGVTTIGIKLVNGNVITAMIKLLLGS